MGDRESEAAEAVQRSLASGGLGATKPASLLYLPSVDANKFVAPGAGRVVPAIGPDGTYSAFIPSPLPRQFDLTPATVMLLSKADTALGRLAGAGRLLPNPNLLITPYVTREAVSSARIEGTQASISDVFEAADEETPSPDVLEVRNYIAALNQGLELLTGLPVSKRLIGDIHRTLLRGVRGREKTPGEFRLTQNFIGSSNDKPQTAVFVPPPPGEHMETALADWERFANADDLEIPLLVQCALLHYQFETIHPFLDGNGRLGRLLIVFFLVERTVLPQPLLYLSRFFEENRREYTDRLQAVRERGELQEWVQFFLKGVAVQGVDAVERAERLADLRERHRQKLIGSRSRATEVVDYLFANPITTGPQVASRLGMTLQGAKNLLLQLQALGILEPLETGRAGRRRWLASDVLEVIGG